MEQKYTNNSKRVGIIKQEEDKLLVRAHLLNATVENINENGHAGDACAELNTAMQYNKRV